MRHEMMRWAARHRHVLNKLFEFPAKQEIQVATFRDKKLNHPGSSFIPV